MYRSGLLILPGPFNKSLHKIPQYLSGACKHVSETLYIQLTSHIPPANESIPYSDDVHNVVLGAYNCAASVCDHIDVNIILSNIGINTAKNNISTKDLDVILHDDIKYHENVVSYIDNLNSGISSSKNVENIQTTDNIASSETIDLENVKQCKLSSNLCKTYKHVVLGGTFDRLHYGHKIMLSQALLLCDEKITIGVTCGQMNANKTLFELMESPDERVAKLKKFINDVKPNIEMNIVPITDPYGPSIELPDIDCIVVSEETLKGGHAVNQKRKENNLNPLEIFEIGLIEDKCRSSEEEVKISSSSLRKRILGNLWRKPELKEHLVPVPYVIGLTGGIASGKSSICRHLESLGAGIVDCDKLGHQVYKNGTSTFKKVVEAFGNDIVDESGEINRRALGSKVFSSKDQLDKLNSLVWPAIAKYALKEVNDFAKLRKKVIIMDAAVLLAAGWDQMVHEIWVCVIPRNEAVRRIMNRNGLSEEDAMKRIDSQKSNVEQIEHANVILSTLWEPCITHKQIEKAWNSLLHRMPPSTH